MTGPMLDTERADLVLQYLRAKVGVKGGADNNKVWPTAALADVKATEAAAGGGALGLGPLGVATPTPASAPAPPPGGPPPGPPEGQPDLPWREDPDYDPFTERVVRLPYSDAGALAHLLKGALGAGLLAISLGFKMSGLGVGVASGVVIAVVCTHCCTLLVENSRLLCKRLRVPSLDFPSTVEAAFLTGHARLRRLARPLRFLVNFMLCFTYLGLPIIFIVVISSSVQQLVQHYTQYELNVRYYILMLLPFVLAMGMVRDLKWLVPLSHASNTLFLTGLSITMYYVLRAAPSPLAAGVRQTGTLADYPLFLSAMIYGMENIGVILPVENTMRHPKHLVAGPNVLIWSMAIIAFCYIFIGAAGFLTFGEATRENIILNLPIAEPAAQAVKVVIPLGVLLSYGLQLYVVPVTLWSGLRHRVPEARRHAALNLLRAATVLFTVVVALVVPNLRPVLALVGAVGFSTLGLLLPALVDLAVHAGAGASALRVAKDAFIVLFWLVALLAGTYSALLEIKDTYFTEPRAA